MAQPDLKPRATFDLADIGAGEKPLPDDIPLWPGSAAAKMKIDVVVNPEGKVLVLHEKPFPDYLDWIEFDLGTGEMTFITPGGKLHELGMIIHPPMDKYVALAKDVCTICVRENEIRDMGLVPLVIHKEGK